MEAFMKTFMRTVGITTAALIGLLVSPLTFADVILTPDQLNQANQSSKQVHSVVNVNTASLAQLTNLTGIGETKAKAIIDYRKYQGAFKSIEELAKVKGIGNKFIEQNRKYIAL